MRLLAISLALIGLIGVAYAASRYKIFNVKDYGAKEDGINDNTLAVRSTIEDARLWLGYNPDKKVIIYFPEGVYLVKQFKIYSNMVLKGDGMDRTVIKRIVTYDNGQWKLYGGIKIDNDIFGYDPLNQKDGDTIKTFISNINTRATSIDSNIELYDLTIDGSGYYFAKNDYDNKHNTLLLFKYMDNIKIDNVKLIDSMNFHIFFKHVDNIQIGKLIIDGNAHGYRDPNEQEMFDSLTVRNNQDGLHMNEVNNVIIDYLKVIESADDSLVIRTRGAEGNIAKTTNVYIKYAEVKSHSSRAVYIAGYADANVEDVTIDTLIVNGFSNRGIHIAHGYKLVESNGLQPHGTGTVKNLTINNLIINTYGRFDFYEQMTKPVPSKNDLIKAIYITSRPQELYDSQIGYSPIENITIKSLKFDPNYIPTYVEDTDHFMLLVTEGVTNMRVENFEDINKVNKGYDIRIMYSSGIVIDNMYIKRVENGGWSIVAVNNSTNILLDNVRIPLLDDGKKQGGYALYIKGNTSYVTMRYKELNTNGLVKYDNVPEKNKQTIKVVKI